MAIVIPALPEQTTTEPADLFVLHNTAINRTKGITYSSLLNEIVSDIEPSFINPSELSSAQSNTLSSANSYTNNKINNFIEEAANIVSLSNTDELPVKKVGGITQSVTFSTLSNAIVANTQPNINTAINTLNTNLTNAYKAADNALLNTQLPLLANKTTLTTSDYIPFYDATSLSTKSIMYGQLKAKLAIDINAVTQSQLSTALANIAADINNAKLAVLQQVFPVGSRISRIGANALDNPATYLGFGVWVKEEGYFYVGWGGYFGVVGGTGGSLAHNHGGYTHEHTLTSAQIPPHSHGYSDSFFRESFVPPTYQAHAVSDFGGNRGCASTDFDNPYIWYIDRTTGEAGGGGSHSHGIPNTSHLPPYKVEVCWRRTA